MQSNSTLFLVIGSTSSDCLKTPLSSGFRQRHQALKTSSLGLTKDIAGPPEIFLISQAGKLPITVAHSLKLTVKHVVDTVT